MAIHGIPGRTASHDIIVVGRGVLAQSLVLALLDEQPSLKIALVGPVGMAESASSAAGAMLGCFGEVTKRLMSSEVGREKLAMSVKAASIWPYWLERRNAQRDAGGEVVISPGTYVLLSGKSPDIDDEHFSAIGQALLSHGRILETPDVDSIPGLHPLEGGRPARAIFLRDEGSIDSAALLACLRESIEHAPTVHCVSDVVESVQIASSRVQGVTLRCGGKIDGAVVVLAAGWATQAILDRIPDLSRRIPRLFPGTGVSVLLRPTDRGSSIPCALRTANDAFACGMHAVPRVAGHLYVGATNHLRLNPWTMATAADVHVLLDFAMRRFNTALSGAELVAINVGNRPVTVDGFPLIGPASVDGLWLLTGTNRDGLHLSPLLAQTLTQEILEQTRSRSSFTPERMPLTTMTREESVVDTVRYQIAAGYRDASLVRGGLMEMYEAIGGEGVLLPEFLAMLIASESSTEAVSFFRSYFRSVAASV